jgi:hypothetical protein
MLRREAHHADQRATELVLTEAGDTARVEAEAVLVSIVSSLVADTPDPRTTLAALAALEPAIERRQAAFAATRGSASPMRSASSSAAQDRIVAEDDALGVAARGGAR